MNMRTPTNVSLHRALFELYQKAEQTPLESQASIASDAAKLTSLLSACDRDLAVAKRYERLIALSQKHSVYRAANATPNQSAARRVKKLPIVLTSINPFSRANLQMRCVLKWQSLGFEVFSFNHYSETSSLTYLGIKQKNIIRLRDGEAGIELHGKPVPKIKAILNHALEEFDTDILLVNSDLYPAALNANFVNAWQRAGQTLGLTRKDVLAIDAPATNLTQAHYRGGLDAFLIPRPLLRAMTSKLSALEISERMCFGIVGWDYLFGALMRAHFGGAFIDSGLLLHEFHNPTYDEIAEFKHYTPAMQSLGCLGGNDFTGIARSFAKSISLSCVENSGYADLAGASENWRPRDLHEEEEGLLAHLTKLAPQLIYALELPYLRQVIQAIALRDDLTFSDLSVWLSDIEPNRKFAHLLLLFTLYINLRADQCETLTKRYPANQKHATVITELRQETADNPRLQRLKIAQIFCTEFADESIFNPVLFNFLVLSCDNEAERSLMSEIKSFYLGAR